MRSRRDEWISAGLFTRLDQLSLEAYDQIVGLDLGELTVDGCIVKSPCGGQGAGRSPVDRGKPGTKRSVLVEGAGIRLGCVVAGANRHDSPLLRPTLERLTRFDHGLAVGLPAQITVHLDAGYDSTATRDLLDELGCRAVISTKGFPLQAGRRWVVERTHLLAQPGLQEPRHRHRPPSPRDRGLHRPGERCHRDPTPPRRGLLTHRWDTRPRRRP